TKLGDRVLDDLNLGLGVGDEVVDPDDRRDAELTHVLDVAEQVDHALLDRFDVFLAEIGLGDAAVHLQRAHGGDDYHGRRLEAGLAALDVEELLGPQVGAEAGFGNDVVGQLERGLGRGDRVAAVGDVGERAAVDERRVVLQRLHQVRLNCRRQQHGHRTAGIDVRRTHRALVAAIADDDVADRFLEILDRGGEAQDRHDFGRDGDVEAGLTRIAVGDAAQRSDDLAQGAVVHVEHTAPGDAAGVDLLGVAPIDVVVDQRAQQVVGAGDRVEVAGEVEVEVLHWHDLGITAAGGAALHAERRAQRRLAQAHRRILADTVEAVGQADRSRGLAFAGRGRVDRGHQDQLAVFTALLLVDPLHGDLGLGAAIGLECFFRDTQLGSDLVDRLHLGLTGDFDIGGHAEVLFRLARAAAGGGNRSFFAITKFSRSRNLYAAHTILFGRCSSLFLRRSGIVEAGPLPVLCSPTRSAPRSSQRGRMDPIVAVLIVAAVLAGLALGWFLG